RYSTARKEPPALFYRSSCCGPDWQSPPVWNRAFWNRALHNRAIRRRYQSMFSKLTINSIAARAVLAPMPRPVRTASGDILAAPLVLVDVQTNEGIVGRSYAFAYTPLMLRPLVQFLRDVTPELVGQA